MGTLRRCGNMRCINNVLALSNHNLGQLVTGIGKINYSKDKDSCCKDIAQTEGRNVEPWPKSDPPPPMWRCECPQQPQPPNYDPYRIRVPDVVVPPLTPSNAKELPTEDLQELETNYKDGVNMSTSMQNLFHNTHIFHPDNWRQKYLNRLPRMANAKVGKDDTPRLAYHGKIKYKHAFDEPWKPLDRMGLLAQAEKEESQLLAESAGHDSFRQVSYDFRKGF